MSLQEALISSTAFVRYDGGDIEEGEYFLFRDRDGVIPVTVIGRPPFHALHCNGNKRYTFSLFFEATTHGIKTASSHSFLFLITSE